MLFAWLQTLAPQHLITRSAGKLAASTNPVIKKTLISSFMKAYNISLDEYQVKNPSEFKNFNDFFTRALEPGARTLEPNPNALICPADGAVSELGRIHQDQLLQAKSKTYSLTQLLAGFEEAKQFENGHFCTIYLAPTNYHRVHMPFTAKALKSRYVPGDLFSVNQTTANSVNNLFARNERWVGLFELEHGGKTHTVAVIMVGAMIVAGIDTVLTGALKPTAKVQDFTHSGELLEQGAELGRFYLGSTAIVLAPPELDLSFASELKATTPVRLGQPLASLS